MTVRQIAVSCKKDLFVPENEYGIHSCRPAQGNKAGEENGQDHGSNGSQVVDRCDCGNAIDRPGQEARHTPTARQPQHNSGDNQLQTSRQHQPEDVARSGATGDTYSDLSLAALDKIRHDAVDPHPGEE